MQGAGLNSSPPPSQALILMDSHHNKNAKVHPIPQYDSQPLHLQSHVHSCFSQQHPTGLASVDGVDDAATATSNLQTFLQHTTPIVPIYHLSKSYVRLRPWKQPLQIRNFHFHLKDLWECFSEWSTFGLGVPIVLPTKEHLTQYYVPYLSAIQLYSSSLKVVRPPIAGNTDNHAGAYEMEVEVEACQRVRFEYMEYDHPGHRVPLYFQVQKLALECADLKNLCSNDLSCSSWMSVVWRPIQRIPACVTIKDAETTFLTYHSLSTALIDDRRAIAQSLRLVVPKETSVALDPFGAASYGLREHVWTAEDADYKLYRRLQASSQAWLNQLQVTHHDFEFYRTRAPKHLVSS